jgi:hypothetical protein
MSDHAERFNQHLTTCGTWQVNMSQKLDAIYTELNNRLPRWASVGGIVIFSLLTGTVGYLARVAGIG